MKRLRALGAGSPYDSWPALVVYLGVLALLLAVAQLVLFGFDLSVWLGSMSGFAIAGLAFRAATIRKARRLRPH